MCRFGRVVLIASGYLAECLSGMEAVRPSGHCVAQATVNELVE